MRRYTNLFSNFLYSVIFLFLIWIKSIPLHILFKTATPPTNFRISSQVFLFRCHFRRFSFPPFFFHSFHSIRFLIPTIRSSFRIESYTILLLLCTAAQKELPSSFFGNSTEDIQMTISRRQGRRWIEIMVWENWVCYNGVRYMKNKLSTEMYVVSFSTVWEGEECMGLVWRWVGLATAEATGKKQHHFNGFSYLRNYSTIARLYGKRELYHSLRSLLQCTAHILALLVIYLAVE